MKKSVVDGGCWYCEEEDGTVFSWEWDANVHIECIKKALQEDPLDEEALIFARELEISNG